LLSLFKKLFDLPGLEFSLPELSSMFLVLGSALIDSGFDHEVWGEIFRVSTWRGRAFSG